jgi:hypothetical protein
MDNSGDIIKDYGNPRPTTTRFWLIRDNHLVQGNEGRLLFSEVCGQDDSRISAAF